MKEERLVAAMPKTGVTMLDKAVLKDSLVIVALPTTGSVAAIAGNYLVRSMEMPLVGHVQLAQMPDVTAIEEGRATAAVRIYGGEVACKLDKTCPKVYVILTDLAFQPAALKALSATILEWAKAGQPHLLLCLEGVLRAAGDDVPDVYFASAQDDVLKEVKKTGLPAMPRALIGGATAHLLLGAEPAGLRCAALLVEALRDLPDGRAAAALLAAMARIMPDVQMDPKPLLKEAMEMEAQLRRLADSAKEHIAGPTPSPEQFV